ncbi:MAG: DUF533 domain-containing protein [Candidatus Electrothrix communis]|nr:MAG: DUF533 domain-containing protein [Candidatus Electrothrix communis]
MDVEKLLGKLLHEVTGSGGNQFKKKHKKYKKKHKYKGGDGGYRQSTSSQHVSKKSSLLGNLTGNLTSGKGLLTAIGLGVGAYEIYRTSQQTQQRQAAVGGGTQYSPQAAPVQPASAPPPPPPPTGVQQEQAMSSLSSVPTSSPQTASVEPLRTVLNEQDVARRLIQVMVGAAHADGMLDNEEEKAILDRLRAVDLAQEEKMFLLEELHHPRTIAELTQGVEDIRLGQAMYAVAASAVLIDTESEREWFDEFGRSLGLSSEVCQFIEENQ